MDPSTEMDMIRAERGSKRRASGMETESGEGRGVGMSVSKGRPEKKKRQPINCAACRRLKIKCDRKVPCGQCVKRGWTHLCPDKAAAKVKDLFEDHERLAHRVAELESGGGPSHSNVDAPDYLFDSPHPDQLISSLLSPPHSSILAPGLQMNGNPPPHLSRPGDSPLASSGTLVVTSGGRSRFIGPSAGSQWLREGDKGNNDTASSSRRPSRSASPTLSLASETIPPFRLSTPISSAGALAGFGVASQSQFCSSEITFNQALVQLPDQEEAEIQTDSYFRALVGTGNSTPLDPGEFYALLTEVYSIRSNKLRTEGAPATASTQSHGKAGKDNHNDVASLHKLSLVFIVLALGMLMNLELPANDSRSKKYCALAQQCLVRGRFLENGTVTSLQTISLMARYLAYSDQKGGFELAYQLRGTALRLMLAMGLHRDGHNWNLSTKDLNQRRRVFWDIYSCDVFSSKNWDRPNGLSYDQFDTKFPDDFFTHEGAYDMKRCQLVALAKEVLDESLRMSPSPYDKVVDLWHRICNFEVEIPFHLRCRSALLAQVSHYPTAEEAEEASPAPSRKDLGLAFKQYTLMLNCSLTIFTLLRPYFVDALYTFPSDPLKSPYANAFLAVVERCTMLISMLQSIHSLFPLSSTRQWHFWTHTFSAAVCLSTIPILAPSTPLSILAFSSLDAAISLFSSVETSLPQRSLRENLGWLLRLKKRALERVGEASSTSLSGTGTGKEGEGSVSSSSRPEERDEVDHLGLVGWRTRLIQLGGSRPNSGKTANSATASSTRMGKSSLGLGLLDEVQTGDSGGIPVSSERSQNEDKEEEKMPMPDLLQDFTTPDFLQQLLGVPVEQPLPPLPPLDMGTYLAGWS